MPQMRWVRRGAPSARLPVTRYSKNLGATVTWNFRSWSWLFLISTLILPMPSILVRGSTSTISVMSFPPCQLRDHGLGVREPVEHAAVGVRVDPVFELREEPCHGVDHGQALVVHLQALTAAPLACVPRLGAGGSASA